MRPQAAHGFERRGIQIAGLRWWIAGLLFLATLISYLDRLTLSILAPTICDDLHLSNFQYASISVWFLLAYSLGQTVFGKLQDRIGTKLGLSIAMAVWSIAETAQAATRGLFSLCGFRSPWDWEKAAIGRRQSKASPNGFPSKSALLALESSTPGPPLVPRSRRP